VLGLGPVDEDELYAALDWLLERQPQIEAALTRRRAVSWLPVRILEADHGGEAMKTSTPW